MRAETIPARRRYSADRGRRDGGLLLDTEWGSPHQVGHTGRDAARSARCVSSVAAMAKIFETWTVLPQLGR